MRASTAAHETITLWKHVSEKHTPPPAPERDPDGLRLHHAMWMLVEVIKMDGTWDEYKLQRWVSFAHGLLVCYRVLTLEQVKHINHNA
jgi:hypothetical protein